ncbi:MAG: DNA-3-methyladenine glycosylase 2 family protein [Chloroflexi bacterium]|nr:DNA-3-methyladenine glycosylase 2 family protein [Chloroflexota bacterium]
MLTYDPEAAIAHLRKADAVLARVIDAVGPFTMEPRDGSFRSLARAIFFQQLAGPAARAIMGRVLAALGTDDQRFFTPQQLLAASDDQLRAAGLSRQKTVYLRDLAQKFASGDLIEDEFARLDDEEVIRRVSSVKGIGRWTAEMFLIFSLGRPDVLPVDDLGVRRGFQITYGLPELPKPQEMQRIAGPWRSYRSVGTWYMWRSLGVALPEQGR